MGLGTLRSDNEIVKEGNSMKSALITGISGQDGAHLSELLLNKGYKVCGVDTQPDLWRLRELNLDGEVEIVSADITDLSSLVRALQHSRADELYHLASQSFVGSSFDHPVAAGLITGVGTTNVLEAVRIARPDCAVYNAATSELYGDNAPEPQDESTPMKPSSPYAVAKLYSYQITRLYREAYGLYCCSGILFNHEGEFRGEEFVTRKITLGAVMIKLGLMDKLYLGSLDTMRDWGYAKEYVEAMHLVLNCGKPNDYVCATGVSHSVRDFCEEAFGLLGLDWRECVVGQDVRHLRPQDVSKLRGNPTKLREELGWETRTDFKGLVKLMINADLRRLTEGTYKQRPRKEMVV